MVWRLLLLLLSPFWCIQACRWSTVCVGVSDSGIPRICLANVVWDVLSAELIVCAFLACQVGVGAVQDVVGHHCGFRPQISSS